MKRRANVIQLIVSVVLPMLMATVCRAQPTPTPEPTPFNATALTNYGVGEVYQGSYPGRLYTDELGNPTNRVPANHLSDGIAAAANIVPRCIDGSSAADHVGVCPEGGGGIIALISAGMSNAHREFCCSPYAFIDQVLFPQHREPEHRAQALNPALVVVDCAQERADADNWQVIDLTGNDPNNPYYVCLTSRLPYYKVSALQIQALWFKDANAYPLRERHLPMFGLKGSTCTIDNQNTVDVCDYIIHTSNSLRNLKTVFPNIAEGFLSSRIYAGYASRGTLNPEPFAYEYGFATKWLIQDQINQVEGRGMDAVAGDLGYGVVPWLAWGPYLWADGVSPRKDGLTWITPQDYASDQIHPSACSATVTECGARKVADMLMDFFANRNPTTNQLTSWFLAPQLTSRTIKGAVLPSRH